MFDEIQISFMNEQRVARLATADANGAPHVVPVCFVLDSQQVYITIDEKPKNEPSRPLKRIRNILENPKVSLVADRYDEDWECLGWIMLRGTAEILECGAEHDRAQTLLKSRYPQYAQMELDELPVIAIRVARVTSWGNLDAGS